MINLKKEKTFPYEKRYYSGTTNINGKYIFKIHWPPIGHTKCRDVHMFLPWPLPKGKSKVFILPQSVMTE